LLVCEEADQVLQAAAETIDRPSGDHVDLAAGGILQQSIEFRALVPALRSADPSVLVKINHLPAGASGYRLKLTPLVLGRLAVSRNTEINADAPHDVAPLFEGTIHRVRWLNENHDVFADFSYGRRKGFPYSRAAKFFGGLKPNWWD
jgi:hypothetical protein